MKKNRLALALALAILATPAIASLFHRGGAAGPISTITATFNNFALVYSLGTGTSQVYQTTLIDDDGNVVDAHSARLVKVGALWYWIGECYGTGWALGVSNGAGPCGVNVYQFFADSGGQLHFKYLGQPFDPTTGSYSTTCTSTNTGTTGITGCYTVSLVYNAANDNYVLWMVDNPDGTFWVWKCTAAQLTTQGCVGQSAPSNVPLVGGGTVVSDDAIVVDGTDAYIVYNSITLPSTLPIYVQKLNADYIDGCNACTPTSVGVSGEGLSTAKIGSTFYITYSTPNCAYCASTGNYYVSASSMTGSWSGATQLSATGCNGQGRSIFTLDNTNWFYWFDEWQANSPGVGNGVANQALANACMVQLAFTGSAINPFGTFPQSVSIPAVPIAAATSYWSGADQTSESATPFLENFTSSADISSSVWRLQTFVPANSGSTITAAVTLAAGNQTCALAGTCNAPNGSAQVSLVTMQGDNITPNTTLATNTLSVTSWSPKRLTTVFSNALTAGTTYGLIVKGTNSSGFFATPVNDNSVYASGVERYSSNSGSSWVTESSGGHNRALKFSVYVAP